MWKTSDVIFKTRKKAQEICDTMERIIKMWGSVSVADFCEIAGGDFKCDFTDGQLGWIDLDEVKPIHTAEGYVLDLPDPLRLGTVTKNPSTDETDITSPRYYKTAKGFETIDVIEAFTAELSGIEATDTANIIKYACRWKNKGGTDDLRKILWYTQHLINYLERISQKESV